MADLADRASTELALPRELVGPYLAKLLEDDRWIDHRTTALAGGRSNLTFVVASEAGEVVVRRPPLSDRAPGAHDMWREFRVMTALRDADVPVPHMFGYRPADDLLDVAFYVMSKVDGVVLDGEIPAGYAKGRDDERRIGEELVDVLGRLHAVDPAEAGLGDFGRPDGYLERQVATWARQWARLEGSGLAGGSRIATLASALAAAVPVQQHGTIVHGDFRLGNVMLTPKDPGRVAAVLDWEMSTLGDPLTDLAVACMFWREADEPLALPSAVPLTTTGDGFLKRRDLVERYARASGRDLGLLSWYVAFASFKYAVICADVYARGHAGAMIGDGFEQYGADVEPFAELGHHALGGRYV